MSMPNPMCYASLLTMVPNEGMLPQPKCASSHMLSQSSQPGSPHVLQVQHHVFNLHNGRPAEGDVGRAR